MTLIYPRLGQAGRLGNQLWEIASTIGMALDRGDKAVFPEDWPYRHLFCLPSTYFGPQAGQDAADLPEHIKPAHRMYLQDYGLWSRHEPLIRAYLDWSTDALEWGYGALYGQDPLLPRHRAGHINFTTAVHIRRTDYLDNPDLFPSLQPDWFVRAMEELGATDSSVILFSDDPDWAESALAHRLNVVHVSRGLEDWQDLMLMSFCGGHVISNSTFSWWGAWLANNPHAAYPWPWYGQGFPDGGPDAQLMIPAGWVEVPR